MCLLWLLLVLCTIHCSNTARQICDNHSHICVYHLSFRAFVPCTDWSNEESNDCDVLIYPAMIQAVEEINSNTGIFMNEELEYLNLKIDLTPIETKVREWT